MAKPLPIRVSTRWPRLRRCSPCEYAQAIRRGSRLAYGAISSETRLMRGSVLAACCLRSTDDPSSRRLQKFGHDTERRHLAGLGGNRRSRFVERQLVAIKRLVCAADGSDIARCESASAQALAVGAVRFRRIPGCGDERR